MRFHLLLLLPLLIFSCKTKKKFDNADQTFFPVTEYLKGQIAEMKNSFATIIKIEKEVGKEKIDTTYIRREDFASLAKDFSSLPDISSPELRDDYEVTNMYDDLLEGFLFTYITTEEDHEIKKQEVIVEPSADGNNIIKTVIIDKWITNGNKIIEKNMLWEAGKRFLIITKTNNPKEPEKINTVEVKWNNLPPG